MPVSEQGHILVVENNDITRKLIVGILNNKGYETYEAKAGDEATSFLAKPLQLLVLDVENDNIDNIGLLHKLKMLCRMKQIMTRSKSASALTTSPSCASP